MVSGKTIAAAIGLGGLAYGVYDFYTGGPLSTWLRSIWPMRARAVRAVTVPRVNLATSDTRPLGEVKADLERQMWADQNSATRAISYLKTLTNNLEKNYPKASQQKVDTALYNIASHRISNATQLKNQAKVTLQQQMNVAQALQKQIENLEKQKSQLATPVALERVASDLWKLPSGQLIEEGDLEAVTNNLEKTRQANIERINTQIANLQSRIPDPDGALKNYHEAKDRLATAEQERKSVPDPKDVGKSKYALR